jgi:hypothetical protein
MPSERIYISFQNCKALFETPCIGFQSCKALFETLYSSTKNRGSAVGIATELGLDGGAVRDRVPGTIKNFHFSISSSLSLGSTWPPIQWVLGAFQRRGGKTAVALKFIYSVN